MNASTRLTARALLIDELYAAKSRAEHERDQLRAEVEDLKKQLVAEGRSREDTAPDARHL